jgi:molybdate transport repressor ModE-like protein
MKRDARRLLKLEPTYAVWLTFGNRKILGELEARMLRAIDQTGSLSLAARTLDVSYPFLWNTISRIERAMNRNLVTRERGGQKGGRSELTSQGKQLLEAYSFLDSRVHRFLEGDALAKGYLSKAGHVRPNLSFVGSHCIVVEKALQSLHTRNPKMTYQMVNVGSWAGLTAMMLREADIAGIHVYDEAEAKYNEPLLSKYWLSQTCRLVRGYKRQQSLIVRKGNPKNIRDISDLLRRDVKLANRNLGSGTRILLDRKLRELAEKKMMNFEALTGGIRGYESEMMTHREVAMAVAYRRADVGIGVTSVSAEMNLEAVPFTEEIYDFLVEKRLRNPYVRSFFRVLASKRFQKQIKASTPGITFLRETGQIIR